ncbi:Superoxide dismutase [Salvia divinorum]|uniref:superoxide dismutase n=1 Tax=Salvia divinorum TaxID=28513 RepID=A0ABD1HS82_SALDI
MAAAVATPLRFTLSSFHGSTRGLQCRKNQKSIKRPYRGVITAKIDHKPPPYSLEALEPHMSRETFEYHWGKHHRAYGDNLNKQIVGTELDTTTRPLEEIILVTYNKGDLLSPSTMLLRCGIMSSSGTFVAEFKAAAATQSGSGWAWLVYKANRLDVGNAVNPVPSEEDKKLVVVKSPNAINPLVYDYSPLLTIDVWEHAYYLDFQNRRPDYISTFMEKLVSWDAVSLRLEAAKARAAEREREEERARNGYEGDDSQTEPQPVEMYLTDSENSEAD